MLTLTSDHPTWAHEVPAGVKLAGLALCTLALFAGVPGPGALLVALGFLLVAGLGAFALGLWRQWAGLMWRLWPFAALIVVWHGVTQMPLAGALILARMLAAVGIANLVTMTSRLSDMQAVFLWLARPLSPLIPPKRLALAMALMLRFLPVMLHREAQLREAWRARSPRRPGWRLVQPLTLAALDDSEQVAEALRARGGAG
ncbi:MAG: energy-coupling factor transporter transmembrane component T [Paracoccaceae bacterium]